MRRFWDNLPLRAKVLAVVAIAAVPLLASVMFALSSASVKMPKVDGLEVARQLKSDPALRTIPILVLASSREEQDLVRSYDLGVNEPPPVGAPRV